MVPPHVTYYGCITDEVDVRRDHFSICDTPLAFSPHDYRPAIFRCLIAIEHTRAIAADVNAMDKLMMANSTPITAARSDDQRVCVERIGTRYSTVFNDRSRKQTVTITVEGEEPASSRKLVTGRKLSWNGRDFELTLESKDVALIELDQPLNGRR